MQCPLRPDRNILPITKKINIDNISTLESAIDIVNIVKDIGFQGVRAFALSRNSGKMIKFSMETKFLQSRESFLIRS